MVFEFRVVTDKFFVFFFLLALTASFVKEVNAQQGVCDPLVPQSCLLPFPNNFFTRSDPSTPTGLRVSMSDAASPVDRLGNGFNFQNWNDRLDGFSISTAIFAHFPNVSLELSRVPGWQDLARSRDSDCPTILLDADTGELLDHFAELDYTTTDANIRAFMIWPTKQLIESHRYIVAMRNLRTESNTPVTASAAFAALRDRTPSGDPDVESRRVLFEEIFAQLEAKGVNRAQLNLAWDFTVGSEKYTTGAMLFMRDDAINRLPSDGPEYTISSVRDNYSDRLIRVIEGEMMVPHYMTRRAVPGCSIVLDENGTPVYQGMVNVPFTVAIPFKCAQVGAEKCPVLVYGHGLTGSQGQVLGGTQQDVADTYGYILAAVDMWGMSSSDVPSITLVLTNDLAGLNIIPDRSHQGMLNQILIMKLVAGRLSNDPLMIYNGQSLVDSTRRFYWGISQGGILGAVYLAVSNDITKAHLGVPGAPYPLLLARSVDFDPYFTIIKSRYSDPIDRIMVLSLLGLLWDRLEPSGYLNLIKADSSKRALIDYANGDAQVSYLGAYFMTRSIGGRVFTNNVHCLNETTPIFDIPVLATLGPITQGSVMIGFEYEGIGCGPVENIPPNGSTDTHSQPRNDARNKANMDSFFRKGEIYDICNGQGCYVPNQ